MDLGKDFERALAYCLSQPPSRVGRRLKSERELAAQFNMSRQKIRRGIQGLVDQQVLAREHGSGVYVRKVPTRPPEANGRETALRLDFDALLVPDDQLTQRKLSRKKRSLALEFWWGRDIPATNTSAMSFKKGIIDQVKELGHQIVKHDLVWEANQENMAGHIRRLMKKRSCDGHIVLSRFAEAFEKVKVKDSLPTVFIWGGNFSPDHQPLIQVDVAEAAHRALNKLADEGFRRIGLLGLYEPDNHVARAYGEALRKRELAPAYMQMPRLNPRQARKAVTEMLTGPNACDAIYFSDDYLLRMVKPAIDALGLQPGRDFGAIALSLRGTPLPEGVDWSRMEFDMYNAGRLAVISLTRNIESAGAELLSFSHLGAWRPGRTHKISTKIPALTSKATI